MRVRVGSGEPGDLTSGCQLEILLLQEELLLGVQAGQLLVAVNSLQGENQSVIGGGGGGGGRREVVINNNKFLQFAV